MLKSVLDRFRKGLAKTRAGVFDRIREVVRRRPQLDAEALEEIEELLIQADVGVDPALRIIDRLRERVEQEGHSGQAEDLVFRLLEEEILKVLQPAAPTPAPPPAPPYVVLVVGENGAGKTTTIGKMAKQLRADGLSVTLVAADTFRAAAVEQLQKWANAPTVRWSRERPGPTPPGWPTRRCKRLGPTAPMS